MIQNTRYIEYARFHGRSAEEQLAMDKVTWSGGCMVGFTQWNRGMIVRYSYVNPNAFTCGGLTDHAGYDAWLAAHEVRGNAVIEPEIQKS